MKLESVLNSSQLITEYLLSASGITRMNMIKKMFNAAASVKTQKSQLVSSFSYKNCIEQVKNHALPHKYIKLRGKKPQDLTFSHKFHFSCQSHDCCAWQTWPSMSKCTALTTTGGPFLGIRVAQTQCLSTTLPSCEILTLLPPRPLTLPA